MSGGLDGFLATCTEALGFAHVLTDPDRVAAHSVDWTRRWQGRAAAVLRPGTTDEVVRIVDAARRHHVGLVPQGGNTGLVGGSVPRSDEVVVDLRRFDALGPVDVAASQVTVGAGATLASVDRHVAVHAMAVGVDLGARESATIGGMVATNAGGLHAVRHGSMRAQVLGVEAVLGTGEVLRVNLAGLMKDNTGYDLAGLLCGSEGTLGIVTTVRLRLVDRPATRLVALVGFADIDTAVGALGSLRSLRDLQALEVMLDDGIRVVARHLGVAPPLDPLPRCVLLVELAGAGDLLAELGGALAELGTSVRASAVAADGAGAERLWRWREAHSEAAAAVGLVHKADVTVPHRALASFVAEVAAVVEAHSPGATTLVYGHLGDGNLHVNVVGPAADDERPVDAVLQLVVDRGGSVSGEHGIGVAKRAWLERQRGPVAVAAMRAVKQALDPDGILNPGVLLP